MIGNNFRSQNNRRLETRFRERETSLVREWHRIWRCLPTVRKTDFQFVNTGSIPVSANICPHSTMDVQHATNVTVKGSSPFEGSTPLC